MRYIFTPCIFLWMFFKHTINNIECIIINIILLYRF